MILIKRVSLATERIVCLIPSISRNCCRFRCYIANLFNARQFGQFIFISGKKSIFLMRIDKLKFNLKLKSKAIGKHRLNETMIHVMRMCQHCAIRIVIETKGETKKNRLAYL